MPVTQDFDRLLAFIDPVENHVGTRNQSAHARSFWVGFSELWKVFENARRVNQRVANPQCSLWIVFGDVFNSFFQIRNRLWRKN